MTNYEKMACLLEQNGMNKKIIKLFLKKFKIEEDTYCCPLSQKIFTLKKGFFPSRLELFGEEGIKSGKYLSDFADYMMHPYNNHFVIWINDKLSLKYTLGEKFAHILPKYYLYIENNGDFTYLSDAPDYISKDKDFIINLLKDKKILIIKPNSSASGGLGLMKVEWTDQGTIKINNCEELSVDKFQELIQTLRNNIVTQYVFQHSKLREIWPESECTLRVIMVKMPKENHFSTDSWNCIVSYARFGTSVSGGASNLSSGGIGIGFDFDSGKLNPFGIRYKEFCDGHNYKCTQHPDSKIIWGETTLPNWGKVRNTILEVCKHYDSLSHLGLDIIITEEGFVFCEINSKPALNYEQIMNGPMLENSETKSYFLNKGLIKIDNSKLFEIWNSCQE